MTHYEQGRRFEWKVAADLTANGYAVMRAAGSKGGTKLDLLAIKPGQLLFIQCKRTGTLPAAEWDRLVEVAGWVPRAVAILAENGPRGRGVVYKRLRLPKRFRAGWSYFYPDELASNGGPKQEGIPNGNRDQD